MLINLLYRDWSIRLIGVVPLLVGVASFDLLFCGRIEPETAISAMVAACGFLGCSGGAALTLLGAHIHDRVAVARPWGGPLPADWRRPYQLLSCGHPEPLLPGASERVVPLTARLRTH